MFSAGLVSISFRQHSPEEILKAMKNAQLKFIEWGSDIHAPCADTEKLNEIVRLQNEYGIKCCSYGTYFKIGENSPEEILPYIGGAKILGTDILRIWCGSKSFSLMSDGEKEKILADSITLSKIAQKENVTLCLEFHPHTYTDSGEATLNLIENAGSLNFKTYWQPNQHKAFEENLQSASLLSPFVQNIHIFNWDEKNRYPLINAKEKWKSYLNAFGGNHCVLLEFMPDDRLESLEEEAKALFEIIN